MIYGALTGMFLMAVLAVLGAVFVLFGQTHQGWIALDCWVHTLCYEDAMAGETFSARCWREYTYSEPMAQVAKWQRRVKLIDKFFGDGHCRKSFEAERRHDYLPKEEK